jgi:hypothetical protein
LALVFAFSLFIDSPTMLLAVKLAIIQHFLPAWGELGNKIKLELVSAPIACKGIVMLCNHN